MLSPTRWQQLTQAIKGLMQPGGQVQVAEGRADEQAQRVHDLQPKLDLVP